MPLPLLGMLGGIGGAAFRGISGIYQNILAGQIDPQQVTYKTSPYAQDNLGLARQLYNGRMAGASAEQNNIFANQANTTAGVARNATSSSQALAMAGATQGQTNQALNNLGVQEAQNKQAQVGNLNQANNGMTAEGDKVYQDQLRKYQEDVAAKAALRNAGMQNLSGAFGDAASLGLMGGMYGPPNSHGGYGGTGFNGTPSIGMPPLAQTYGTPNPYAGYQQAPGQAPRIPTFNYITGRYE